MKDEGIKDQKNCCDCEFEQIEKIVKTSMWKFRSERDEG